MPQIPRRVKKQLGGICEVLENTAKDLAMSPTEDVVKKAIPKIIHSYNQILDIVAPLTGDRKRCVT